MPEQPTPVTDAPVAPAPAPDVPWLYVVLAALVAYLPFVFLGYGTDLDVAGSLRGDDGLQSELTSRLDDLGGPILLNLVSVAFGLLALWAVRRLLLREGARWPGLAVLVLAANPWFWIASTSLVDVTWALGLGLAGAALAATDRRVAAGVLFGLAIGCRPAAGLLVLAWLVAERIGEDHRLGEWVDADDEDIEHLPPDWEATATTAALAAVVGGLCLLAAGGDHGLDLLGDDDAFAGWAVHAGRWLVKNLATATLPAALVLLVGGRHLLSGVARWRTSVVVRFALLTVVLVELAYLRLPRQPVHLLPVVAAVALLVGAAPLRRRRWIAALVAAQLLAAFVGTTLAAPDVPDRAEDGRIALRPADGVIVNDVRCRLDDADRGEWPTGDSAAEQAEADARALAGSTCQADAWRDAP